MIQDYSNLIRRIEDRYNPDQNRLVEQRMFSDLSTEGRDVAKYVKMAMSAVDDHYTAITKEAGEVMKKHLKDEQQYMNVTYRYQGSVMTNTHIKGASDIDLLTFTNKFVSTEIFEVRKILKSPYSSAYDSYDLTKLRNYADNFSLYTGDFLQDLRELRASNESVMRKWYDECDIEKAKAVHIYNKNLKRDVDIVTACWQDKINFVVKEEEKYRGVSIYNKKTNSTEPSSCPFLAIENINNRSAATNGRLKQMIRFLKNVRSDSDVKIELTSFEINAVCYSIPVDSYRNTYYLDMVYLLWHYMYNLLKDENQLLQIKSVDGTEYVFQKNRDKIAELRKLKDEVWQIYQKLNN